MKRPLAAVLIFTLPLFLFSCHYFLSSYDGPLEAAHGYVDGVTPANASLYNNRTYPTVEADWPGPGGDKVWLAMNLGATDFPESSIDNRAGRAGWLFQFNRSQGYHHNGQLVTPNWRVTSIDEDTEWELENDPCHILLGEPWRIPTVEMLRAFREAPVNRGGMGEGNRTAAFNSTLRLHSPGFLHSFSGDLRDRGNAGHYWARDQFNSRQGEALGIGESSGTFGGGKAFGRSVRCVKDD
ncbi:MAG: hypothetical protein JJU13_17640 [Balneolaceae bacterium]|nr:hypothetical protein [Balneolaceae bacterium]